MDITAPNLRTRLLEFAALMGCAMVFPLVFPLEFTPNTTQAKFDQNQWAKSVSDLHQEIHTQILSHSYQALSQQEQTNTDPLNQSQQERRFAATLLSSTKKIGNLIDLVSQAPRSRLSETSRRLIFDLQHLDRLLHVVSRVHLSRAIILHEAQTVHHAFLPANSVDIPDDGLSHFWKTHRPWLDQELLALRKLHSVNDTNINTSATQGFIQALDIDLERLVQVAYNLEMERVDHWLDWATRQPRSSLPEMKLMAIEQVTRLETLLSNTQIGDLEPDPRIYSLRRNLRRIASVSSPSNW
ncbi:MAG: hypothetical protein RBT63_02010 [Bdellovibrionales bacterium]|jgi:hypothetical protein|nr:hypothetical protein [Bdellovibrionales bacterium]